MTQTLSPRYLPVRQWISTTSEYSLGVEQGQLAANQTGVAWSAANRAYFVPFSIPATITVARLWCHNGATVAGTNHVDLGIYLQDGTTTATLVASSGSTVHTGTSVIQFIDVTDFALPAGRYYFAAAKDDASDIINGTPATTVAMAQAWGVATMDTAFPLPSTATLVLAASAQIPHIGLSTRSGL